MGLFDEIIADFKCPYCGHEILKEDMGKSPEDNGNRWQTKATNCLLDIYKIGDELEFKNLKVINGWLQIHNSCTKCKKFVEAEIEINDNRLSDKVVYLKANGE